MLQQTKLFVLRKQHDTTLPNYPNSTLLYTIYKTKNSWYMIKLIIADTTDIKKDTPKKSFYGKQFWKPNVLLETSFSTGIFFPDFPWLFMQKFSSSLTFHDPFCNRYFLSWLSRPYEPWASMYESSGSQFFKTTTEIHSVPDPFDESRLLWP